MHFQIKASSLKASRSIKVGHCVLSNIASKMLLGWAVVVAQLVERLLLIPEVRSSNPVIGKNYIEHLLSTLSEKTKIKKRGREGPI